MRVPAALRRMDDRVLGDRFKKRPTPTETEEVVVEERTSSAPPPRTGKGAEEALSIVYRISRLVFLALALACLLGILFTLAPTNEDNVIVENVLDLAKGAAGPFRDVFTANDAERERVVNYAFAAFVYFLASVLVGKLPGGKK